MAGGGFLDGFMEVMQPEIERKRAKEDQLKASQADLYLQSIKSGRLSPEQTSYAWDQYSKLSGGGKDSKQLLGRVGELFKKIHGSHQEAKGAAGTAGSPTAPSSTAGASQVLPGPPADLANDPQGGINEAPQASAAQALPPPSATASSQLPPPNFASILSTAHPGPDALNLEKANQAVAYNRILTKGSTQDREEIAKTFKDTSEAAKEKFIATGQWPASAKAVEHGIERPGMEGAWTRVIDPLGEVEWLKEAPKSLNAKPTQGKAMSISNAQKLHQAGMDFLDPSGDPIDLTKLPPEMGLQHFVAAGGKQFWVPFDPTQREVTVGNVKYAVGPWDPKKLGEGSGVALGQAQPPTSGTSSQISIDPATGEAKINTLPSSRQTASPGVAGRGTQAPGPQSPTVPPLASPAGPVPLAPGPQVFSGPTKAAAQSLGLPPAVYNQYLQRVTAVREANTQLLGDPTQPSLKPLKDFGALADDPKSRERIGTALRMTFDGMEEAENSSGAIRASMIHVPDMGIVELIRNYSGLREKVAKSKGAALQNALSKLSPQEQDAYDATLNAFGTVIGLRSLTRASAAQFSIKRLEQELPIIGINATSSRQFYDQLGRLSEQVYNGVRGVPPSMFDKDELSRIKSAPGELEKLKDGSGGPPSSSGPKKGDQKTFQGATYEFDGTQYKKLTPAK